MKDSDSSPDKTENADDMSLADLLGGGEGKAEDESPRRVEHRDDEPDSGMVNLAKMVAASSIEVAKTPSMAPPPPPTADQSGVRPVPAADPSGVVPTQGAMAAAPVQKKSSGAVYALIAVVVVAAIVIGVIVMNKGGGSEDTAAIDKMMAELQAKAEADRKAAEEKEALLLAKLEEMSKAAATGSGTVSAEDQAKMDAVKAQIDAAKAEKEAAEKKAEEAKTGSSGGTAAKTSDKPKKETSAASTETKKETTTKKTDSAAVSGSGSKTTDKPTETAKGGSTSELDSLLGGGGAKEKPAEEKPVAKAGDDLPKQPSKEQVTAAMAPIKAKAQASCAKYSTGTVQVSMVVSSEGKVKSATATGVFANNSAGTCAAMMARSAKFPKFKDPTFTFTYPIVLQ